jgi:exodeoxyribonuclease VII small subunit
MCFEDALRDLEQIVRCLEDGETGLEEALAQYEKGVALLKQCFGQLQDAERRILALTGETVDGEPATRPFEHAATLELHRPDGVAPRKRPPAK